MAQPTQAIAEALETLEIGSAGAVEDASFGGIATVQLPTSQNRHYRAEV